MRSKKMKETYVDSLVTYTLEHGGKFYIIEQVPARVCRETGEPFFAPETVERIHRLIKDHGEPVRLMQTPVYQYA